MGKTLNQQPDVGNVQATKHQQNHVTAQRVAELRGIKTKPNQSQKETSQAEKQQKTVEKGVLVGKFTNLVSR